MGIIFNAVKKLEIIVKGEDESFLQNLLQSAGAPGYTLIRDISGKGHEHFHEGRLLFNDKSSLVMFIAIVSESVIDEVAEGLIPLFEKKSGVMFVSDAQVVRLERFMSH